MKNDLLERLKNSEWKELPTGPDGKWETVINITFTIPERDFLVSALACAQDKHE